MKTMGTYNIMCGQSNEMVSRLLLQDVRPAQNRYRSYEIKISQVETNKGYFHSLMLSWGRIGKKKARKVYVLDSTAELNKLLKPILRTRYRHGYQIISQSRNFPEAEILMNFKKWTPLPSLQLDLF